MEVLGGGDLLLTASTWWDHCGDLLLQIFFLISGSTLRGRGFLHVRAGVTLDLICSSSKLSKT